MTKFQDGSFLWENDSVRDLNDLNFFAAVVANGGFSAASRALAIPKSRISRRVAALEGQLGVRLLERSSRRFSVTEVGQDVYRHARAAVTEAEAIEDVAARLKAEPQGLVRGWSCPLGADRILATDLPRFLARHPRLRVQVIVSNSLVDLIVVGVDVAIRVRERLDSEDDLQLKIIGRTRSKLVASPAFPWTPTVGRRRRSGARRPSDMLSQTERQGVERWTLLNAYGPAWKLGRGS